MRIGFTGTQKGMTKYQKDEVARVLLFNHPTIFIDNPDITFEAHHGDCKGADAEFEQLAKELGYTTYAHPASDVAEEKKAHCKSDYILPAKPALKRNHDIVDAVTIMIAAPKENHEVLRSGTWATIRYARKEVEKGLLFVIHMVYP